MLTDIDIKRLPSYELGPEAGEAVGEARGEARGSAMQKQAIVRQLLRRFDAAQVAEVLQLSVDEVQRIAGADDPEVD